MNFPVLSVVIPTYNSEAFLEPCLASVRRELDMRVEFILVDGASTDQTMSIVERNRDLFSTVISEKDSGQSEAFNKGFNKACGRYLTWLNSDDVLCPGAIRKAVDALEKSDSEWCAANVIYLDGEGLVTRCCRSGGFEDFAVERGLLNVFGPSTFFTKKLYEELGPINESYHYCMDTEYWWRIVASGRRYERLDLYFWGLRLHSAAKTANVLLDGSLPAKMNEERVLIAERYYPNIAAGVRRLTVFAAQAWRVMNGAYIKSYIDTKRFSCGSVEQRPINE